MVVSELDDVHYDLEVDGELVRRQLARQVWERRGWATIAVAFQERPAGGAWKAPKVAVLRFRRMHDAWKRQAVITLAGAAASALGETLVGWRGHLAGDDGVERDDDDA